MTARRPTPTPRPRRWSATTRSTGSSAAAPRKAASPVSIRSIRASRHAYLIGECANDFARQLRGKLPFTQCGTLDKAVAAASADARKDAQAGRDRAAVARLRLVGPVSELRSARRSFPHPGRGRSRTARKGRHDQLSRAPTVPIVGLWWWTVDRWTLADRRRADVHGRDPGAGREPGGRDPHRARQLPHGAPALS